MLWVLLLAAPTDSDTQDSLILTASALVLLTVSNDMCTSYAHLPSDDLPPNTNNLSGLDMTPANVLRKCRSEVDIAR